MSPTLYYCYDAYCGWCYGFSPVIRRIFEDYRDRMAFEVLSGGMILPEKPMHIGAMVEVMREGYPVVEERTGIKFGEDWLWHVRNPEESDWYPNSEKPAIAMCVFKDYHHDLVIPFASDLQYALHYEGRDLCDDEAYRHLLEKYVIPDEEFYSKLRSKEYKDRAYEEFALVKQLGITGFPTVLLQVNERKMYLVCRGYMDDAGIRSSIDRVLGGMVGA